MDVWIDPQARAATQGHNGPGVAAAAVTKKLAAGAAGTRRLLARFGAALVCVRYRGAAAGTRRYTTVELVVDERPGKPDFSLVRIDYRESTLRQQVKAAGGVWDARKKLWHLPRTAVRHLGLKDRVVADNGQIRKTGHA